MSKLKNYILIISLVMFTLGLIILGLYWFLDFNVIITLVIYAICLAVLIVTFVMVYKWRRDADHYNGVQLNASVDEALDMANVAMIVYNENYEVTWTSELFEKRDIKVNGQKLMSWIPDLRKIINGDLESIVVIMSDHKYEVTKKDNASVLFFKDITENYDLRKHIADNAVVFGLLNFDNLDEISADDEDISTISNDLKLPVLEYLKEYGVTYKTLRTHRMFLILNEKIYQKMLDDRFSILNTVRKTAKRLEVPVTLSIALARGSNDLKVLDEMASSLLELAKTRGGDQVAVRKLNEDVVYFGGTSEAKEKSSRVQVRVMTNTIKDLIQRSDNVIICGHTDADADCVGAAICMSDIAQSFKKECFIIAKTGGIESRVQDALNAYKDNFDERHRLVSINEALNHLHENTLVIMVDHHRALQSNGKELLANAKRIIIIDHHRRVADFDTNPILTYIEPAASSTCELVVEFLPYLMGRVSIAPIEASLMYLGILIDTNRFRVRSGVRTFEVLKTLRQYGADLALVESFNEEPYDMVLRRSMLINDSYKLNDEVVISKNDTEIFPRSIISQAGDSLLQTIGIKAVFVIAKIGDDEIAISARSKGGFNVQVVMEKMNGGGHMSAAGLQVKGANMDELEKVLINCIDEYIKGESE